MKYKLPGAYFIHQEKRFEMKRSNLNGNVEGDSSWYLSDLHDAHALKTRTVEGLPSMMNGNEWTIISSNF